MSPTPFLGDAQPCGLGTATGRKARRCGLRGIVPRTVPHTEAQQEETQDKEMDSGEGWPKEHGLPRKV